MISIVIPVYNEELAIAEDVRTILTAMDASGMEYELLVVDDGSTDRTPEIVAGFPQVKLIRHPYNRGTGAARTTGMLAARGEIVAMTDGDGTYPNQDMPKLIEALGPYDMVIGARKREAGTVRILRTPTKAFIRGLASYLTGRKIPDLNSGMRAVRKSVAVRFLNILPTSHSWVSTITIALLSSGHTVGFYPIDYYPRKGKSTFHPFRDTYNYLSLVVRTIVYFNPLKVFLPISLFLLAAGFGKIVYDIIAYNWHFAPSTVILIVTGIQIGVLGMLADLVVRKMGGTSGGSAG